MISHHISTKKKLRDLSATPVSPIPKLITSTLSRPLKEEIENIPQCWSASQVGEHLTDWCFGIASFWSKWSLAD